ncbi:hypothetical protein V3C99_000860 [Haemonchus contortus]|uniref:Reverse transcriptase domain-containing protein n=1 Tax=Haemonchus contortus TaxID=6289 RepID=A0A7I4YER8_HAECO
MLIRFRLSLYTATSDVEKAFLQVRLHEMDRDATRVLWIRNIDQPIADDNIVTYRFTRVTFGLNVSPFLLAGTIHHHLSNAVSNKSFAQEIRVKLYVDNLVLSADTQKDLSNKITASRQIFADMNMNLREFLANRVNLKNIIPAEACAQKDQQKVLGIRCNAANDSLHIACSVEATSKATKRTVARQIASIYDPLGWLVPLLTRAKHFQQTLWKHNFGWDTPLPENFEDSWNKIAEEINGFQRTIPRRLLEPPAHST